jgi:hypothetical protein
MRNARARKGITEHKATRARSERTRDRGAQGAPARAYRTRCRAIGLKCYGYLDPKGRWELVVITLELHKKTELEELKHGRRRGHKVSLWSFRL